MKLGTIQHLRAVAALGVVFYHASSQVDGGHSDYVRMGAAGVDLFFVISGFIMWVTAIARDESPGRFALKRIIRIVPLYWLITTAVVLIVLAKPDLMRSASLNLAHIASSYGFIAWPHPRSAHRFWPLVIPGWTLNYEMLFYAIVTIALFLPRRARLPSIAASLGILAALGALLSPRSAMAFYTNPILLEFVLGMCVGVTFTRGVSLPRTLAYAAILAALTLFLLVGPFGTDENRLLTWGIPMALLVLGAVNVPKLLPERPFRLLGDASYSLYLTQFCIIGPCARVLAPLASAHTRLALIAAIIVVACVVGVATYTLVEAPLTNALRRLVENDTSQRASASASRMAESRN